MGFFVNVLCYLFVALVGVWVGWQARKNNTTTQGKLVIVRDEVDGETYTGLYMSESLMNGLKTGDYVRLKIEVRQ